MNRIQVGIIGLGNSGWFYHAEASLEDSNSFKLVAVAGGSAQRTKAAAERFGVKGCEDWNDLVQNPTVEVVVIATPTHLHYEMARRALFAGKHVVVDKPITLTADDGLELERIARERGLVLTVFQNRRWEPTFQMARKMVASGEIGEVWRVEERRIHGGPYKVAAPDRPHAGDRVAAWTQDTALGGGVTWLVAPHLIDHQLLLLGFEPESVAARMHTFDGEHAEHYLDLELRYSGDVLSRVEVLRDPVIDLPKWTVYGTKGTIVATNFTQLELRRPGQPQHSRVGLPEVRGVSVFYDQLSDAILNGAPPPVDPNESVAGVRVMELAHQSARSHGMPIAYSRPPIIDNDLRVARLGREHD